TRARHEMHIFIPKKSANSPNPVRLLIKEVEAGQKIDYLKKRKEIAALEEISPASYRQWHDFLKEEFADQLEVMNFEKLQKGQIIHCLLSYIGNAKGKDINLLVKQALEKTRFKFAQVKDFTDYEEIAAKLLKKEELKKFFYTDADIFLEKEIADSRGHIKRLDRLVVGAQETWILDYKSIKVSSESNFEQIKEYIGMVKQIYPKKDVRGYLLYLDDLSLEEISL
ncbi:MAG: hypothetical protein NC936_01890, partial [Candidatus Omnitrophica bacterium]|nr:hypothetical protein [Candidatus Omnitrophota bacterium]